MKKHKENNSKTLNFYNVTFFTLQSFLKINQKHLYDCSKELGIVSLSKI